MRSLCLLLLTTTPALADLPPTQSEHHERTAPLEQVAKPCLRPQEPPSYLVTWWIENTETGERRSIGSRDVRLRC